MLASPDRNGFSQRPSCRGGCATCRGRRGQLAEQELRPDGTGAQLRMGEQEVVLPLGHVVGEFVAEGEADAARACRPCRSRRCRRPPVPRRRRGRRPARPAARPARHEPAVALVEPFRLDAGLARAGLPPSRPMRNIFIELVSVSSRASATLWCISSRVAAEPRWVRPVPVTSMCAWSPDGAHPRFPRVVEWEAHHCCR